MARDEVKVCGCHLCWHQCEVRLHVEDGILKHVTGNPNGVTGGGYGCERLAGVPEFHYSSKRLNHPRKRVGKRGSGRWERVTWEEALDDIAARLLAIREESGPEALAKLGGTIHGPADWASWRFFNQWGSPNSFNTGKDCGQANTIVECTMYGWDSLGVAPMPGKSRNIVLWGSNPPESAAVKWNSIRACQDRGARLIVVDPRFSEAASYADLWLQPRPATDGALGWGVIHILIEEGLYDKEFVERWCTGFDQVTEKAKKYSPERVSKITGVPVGKILRFARAYADGPTNYVWSLSGCHYGNGAGYAAVYTQAVIRAITGNIDREGGNPMTGPLPNQVDWYNAMGWDLLVEHLEHSDRDSVTANRFPVCSKASLTRINGAIKKAWGQGYGCPLYFLYPSSRGIYDAIRYGEPYPIRALFIHAGNPLVTLAGARDCYEALKKVDLLVGMDFFMTPSMALCDYVLPAASWIERPHTMLYWGVSATAIAYEQPLPALYERKDDYWLWKELAHRVGLPYEWPDTLESMYDLILRPSGRTHAQVANSSQYYFESDTGREFERYAKEGRGFGTASGKCELAPSALAACGLDPVPDYVEPPQSRSRTPELAREYPLTLISGSRVRPYWHTSYRELSSLRWRHELPETQMHPETARAFGIVNGDTVLVETPLGSVRQRACVTTAIAPDVVHAEAFWYYPEQPAEDPYLFGVWDSNINAIIPDDYDVCDFAGDHPYRGLLCRIRKAETPLDFERPVFNEFD
ncbi:MULTISPECIES: molybdopterin-containing oxidoreductase family protein [Gordonibacter]|uniref:Molybdopterin-dependent oxidoreductase n=1 Tax=Gordonibacter faecis TaxID=3047475 RepID=A0ABT7DK43_9ACTN|nr:molybdopterin-dependent oxidoreductase [Gordonibacter sp. KGMB12511]MDJ1649899.1 molybdopterin-dependent oxidoreductase [Gordonibacter sp. KGMB12511]